ncbi:hypothetical protein, partial [Listeria monocytogenes]|uniref:hypothetical protein n=1 Tax=Listeria monocytogenes TaxID=1639 RepID=UPI001C6F2921
SISHDCWKGINWVRNFVHLLPQKLLLLENIAEMKDSISVLSQQFLLFNFLGLGRPSGNEFWQSHFLIV